MPHPSGLGSYVDMLARRISPEQRSQLGNELRPGVPACFLFWFAEKGQLEPGLIPASIPDFVLSVLCGAAPGVEVTNAMAYGVFNLETLDWHHNVIKQLGLSHLHWPALRQHGKVVGYLKVGAKSVPCYTPVGDSQCALVGSLVDTEELAVNVSTGSQVSRITRRLILGDFQTRPYFDGMFLNTFTHLPAGRSLKVLIDLLMELAIAQKVSLDDPWSFIARAAKNAGDTDLEVKLTFFAGPYGDRGMISNIRGDNFTIGHLFRAAFKNMADIYYSCALRLWPEQSWRNIVFSGRLACKVELLREIIQKRFGTNYRLCPSPEDALFGLLILALAFSGRVGRSKGPQENFARPIKYEGTATARRGASISQDPSRTGTAH